MLAEKRTVDFHSAITNVLSLLKKGNTVSEKLDNHALVIAELNNLCVEINAIGDARALKELNTALAMISVSLFAISDQINKSGNDVQLQALNTVCHQALSDLGIVRDTLYKRIGSGGTYEPPFTKATRVNG